MSVPTAGSTASGALSTARTRHRTSRRSWRRMWRRRWGRILLVAAGVVVVAAPAAAAHSVLVSSNPPAGSIVRGSLTSVSLTFDENVRAPAYVVVTGPGAVRVDQGPAQILDSTVTEHLVPAVTDGAYTVAYRVVSADGHPVEKAFGFTLTGTGRAAAAAPAPAQSTHPPGGAGLGMHILLGLLAVTAGAGALMYERARRTRHPS